MTGKSAEAEVEKLKALEARIKAPCIWGRIIGGIRIEDLQDKRFDEAINFLKEHYLNEEITYRSVKILEDKESTDEFAYNARVWLKDKASYAVIKEGTGALIGVMITRLQEKCPTEVALTDTDAVERNASIGDQTVDAMGLSTSFSRTFSRVKLTYSKEYSKVMTFLNAIERPVDLFAELGVKKYVKIYLIALLPRYRHRGISTELIRCAITSSKNAGIPALVGIFTTGRGQTNAEKLGFVKFNEVFYVRYMVDDEMVFTDTGLGNYGAAIMGLRIEGVDEPESDMRFFSSSSKHLAAASSKGLGKSE